MSLTLMLIFIIFISILIPQMTLILPLIFKLDLDTLKMFRHTKHAVSVSRHSKFIARTDTQTNGETGTHRQYENITFPHTRAGTSRPCEF